MFLFFLLLQVLAVIRVVYASKEISFNLILFFYSTLKQFFYFILSLQVLVFISYSYQFMRYPFDLYWYTRFYSILQTEISTVAELIAYIV